ncbi:nectin-1-like isoform X2 [Lethenteron reissneri]|uniref:nectin-1-like isoform X2 n=1 Tax=Lethenteron reissneri TaxID=7753 RepID=UPI002AB6794A|nr:nectin-1-like isoform X2 [Lethenteron reissneri]
MDTLCFAQRVMIAVHLLLLLPATLGAQSVTSEIEHDSEASGGSGGDVKLRCVYTGSETVIQIGWVKETTQEPVYIASRQNDQSEINDKLKGRLTFLGHGNNNATISIRALRASDSGSYICTFTTTTKGTKEVKINLIVVVTPEVTLVLGPAPLVSGRGASQLAATCVAANGNPAAKIAWTLKNVSGSHFVFEALKDDAGTIIDHKNSSISVTRELRLEPTKEMNKASLACVVTQSGNVNQIEKIVALNVHYKPKVTTISGVTGPMQEGSTKVTLTCLADANPSAKYSWMRNGTHMNGSDHSTLTLDRAVSNSGMYRCIAVNDVGTDFGDIDVNITYAPAQPTTVPTTMPGTGSRVNGGPGSLVWIGVGLGVLIIVMGIAVGVCVIMKKRMRKSANGLGDVQLSRNTETVETEITYAELDRTALHRGQRPAQHQPQVQQDSTIYAHIVHGR